MLFEWKHEIVHIFSDEDFEYEISSFFQEYFRDIEDSEVELDRAILIYSCHPRRRWCDIRSDEIKLPDPERVEINTDFLELEDTLLEKVDIRKSKVRIDLLYIDTDSFSFLSDDLRDHLEK
jgi:hypothetical protein